MEEKLEHLRLSAKRSSQAGPTTKKAFGRLNGTDGRNINVFGMYFFVSR